MALTAEQQAIVDAHEPEVLAVAGAGTGKTHALVERYITLLARHRVDQLVAITFTDNAAAELRERVRRAIATDPSLAGRARELDDAPIGTIHSLCLRLLVENAAAAGLDPATRVLGEDEAEYETLLACADALEAASAEAGDALAILELAHEGGPESVLEVLAGLVRARDDTRSAFAAMGTSRDEVEAHVRSLCDRAIALLRARVADLAGPLAAVRCHDPSDRLYPFWEEAREAVTHLPDDPSAGAERLGDLADALRNMRNVGRKDAWSVPPPDLRALLHQVRDVAGEAAAVRFGDHDGPAIDATLSLRDLFDDAVARYAERKRRLGALDYLDLEILARDLLRDHPGVAALYHRRFRHVLVDEYQDTNPIQVEIIDLLTGGGAVHRFYVGDAKQAIYRFRGGDVRGFNRTRERLRAAGLPELPLSQSFRAHRGIVGVINALFESVFAGAHDAYEATMDHLRGRDGDSPEGPHLTVIKVAEGSSEEERTRYEAYLVALEIRQLLSRERPVWDREGRLWRPVRPGDIAILLRRFTKVGLFEEALAAEGLPYETQSGAGFFHRPEIVDLSNLLCWLAEPDDEIALAGVLRSPLAMIDDATLLALRRGPAAEERRARPFTVALQDPGDSLDESTRARVARVGRTLEELRRLAEVESVDVVLAAALARTGVEASWRALPGGDQAIANMRKLLRMAHGLRSRTIDEFAAYLVRRRDELATRESQAVLDAADAVRVLTVHGAKGLEFPVVFVPEANVPPRSTGERVLVDRELGLSMTLAKDDDEPGSRPRPGFYAVLKERADREDVAEHRRLFYVASTRAADYLYLLGAEPKTARHDNNWLAWAGHALSGRDAPGVEVREPAAVDLGAIRRDAPKPVVVPGADEETDYESPLVARPPVIPVRTSTPVTALLADRDFPAFGHGDGLAAFRGVLAHRAIELTYGGGNCPPLVDLARQVQERPAPVADIERIAAEVETYLSRFAETPLGRDLSSGNLSARFEVPFAWDWDGVPVHGIIDLLYEDRDGGLHVVDFKTDRLDGRTAEEAVRPYLAQLGLYGLAVERATGSRPTLAACFLRTGDVHAVEWSLALPAIAAARERVDAGMEFADEVPEAPSQD